MDEPRRIAIVDPDYSFWQDLRIGLRGISIEIEAYPCAEGLLATSRAESLGCIVVEMELPGASGLDLMMELRRLGINVPIIILSSRSDLAGAVSAMQAGAIDYLQKPFVKHKVRDWIHHLLQLAPA